MPIHISSDYSELYELAENHRYTDSVDRAVRKAVRSAVDPSDLESIGLRWVSGVDCARLISESGQVLERHSLYGYAPVGEEVEAARRMVATIAEHGPGKLWTIGHVGNPWAVGHVVDIPADDGRVPICDIDGVTHVLLRSYYFHEPAEA